jgi:PAS domain S-box-containing protein
MQRIIGERLKYFRLMSNLSRGRLAEELGVTERHVGLIERGGCYPSMELLIKAASILQTNPANFLLPQGFEPTGDNASDAGSVDAETTAAPAKAQVRLITCSGVWIIDFATGRETWSRSLRSLLGISSGTKRSPRETFLDLLPSNHARAFKIFLDKVLDRGRPRPVTCVVTRSDGMKRTVLIQAEQLADDEEFPLEQARLFIHDVTEWTNFHDLMIHNQQRLEAVVHERTRDLRSAMEEARDALDRRIEAQRELETKNRQLERLFAATPAILYSFVPGVGGTEIFSPHVRRILGYTDRELTSNPMLWNSSIHPEDAAKVDEAILNGLGGAPISLEYRIKTKSGQWRWLHDQALLAHDEEGRPFFSGVSMDVTEHKRMEEELIKARNALHEHGAQRYRRRNEMVYRYEFLPQRGFSYVSPSVTDITGYTPEEHYADPDLGMKIIHPEDLALLQGISQEIDQGSRNIVLRWIRKDGQEIWTEQHLLPITNDQGELLALEGFVRDVTMAKQTEEKQKHLLARYKALFENSSEGVFLHDMDGNILDANQAILDMFGYTLDELHARHPMDLVHPDDVAGVRARFADILELKITTAEHRCRRKDGSEFIALVRGKLVGKNLIQGILRDVTQERRRETELVLAKDAAQAATRAKSEFLANMSHELRTPFNGIMGILHLLRDTRLDDEQTKYVFMALESAERYTQLMTDILNFSRIAADRDEDKDSVFQIDEICSSTKLLFAPLTKQKGVSLDYVMDSSAPGPVVGNAARVRLILFHLMGNAVKFTEQGTVRLTASATQPDAQRISRVVFTISDTGIGIPSEKLPDLFHPFTQLDGSYTRKYEGAGLGLAIVDRLVKMMGGDIDVESTVGAGTTVRVELPFHVPEAFS